MKGKKRSLLYGAGINDVMQPTREIRIEYLRWVHIVNICHGPLSVALNPKPVLDERWKYFSNFLEWLYEQPNWRDYELHRGIKKADNNVYSPDLCVMVHPSIRRAFRKRVNHDNGLPRGVTLNPRHKKGGKNLYVAQGQREHNGKTMYLGSFSTAKAAHRCWQKDKVEHLIYCLSLDRSAPVFERLSGSIEKIQNDIRNGRETIDW